MEERKKEKKKEKRKKRKKERTKLQMALSVTQYMAFTKAFFTLKTPYGVTVN